jgi:hypothetical protein
MSAARFAVSAVHFTMSPVHFTMSAVHFVMSAVRFIFLAVHFVMSAIRFMMSSVRFMSVVHISSLYRKERILQSNFKSVKYLPIYKQSFPFNERSEYKI